LSYCKQNKMDETEYDTLFRFLSGDCKVYPAELSENEKRTLRRKSKSFCIKQNEIYYIHVDKKTEVTIDKLVITRKKVKRVLYMCHNESGCHLGVNKTVNKIATKYYFPSITENVRDYISKCEECQRQNKKTKTLVPELQPVECGSRVWGKIGIDLIGPFLDANRKPISENGYR